MISFMKVEEKLAMYLIVSKLSTKYVCRKRCSATCEIEPQAENGIYHLKQKGSSHFAVTSYRHSHPLWIPTYSRRKPISSIVPQSAGLVESDF